jgi:hypothetical protein
MVLKALALEESDQTIAFVDSRMEGIPQTKSRPKELNT